MEDRGEGEVVPDVPTAGVRGGPGPDPREDQQRRQHAHRYLQTWHCPAVFHQLARQAGPAAGAHYRSECFLSCRRLVALPQVGVPRRACARLLVDAGILACRGPWCGVYWRIIGGRKLRWTSEGQVVAYTMHSESAH